MGTPRTTLFPLTLAACALLFIPGFFPLATAAPDDTESATVSGYVFDVELDRFLSNQTVTLDRDYYLGNNTVTDANGYYSMNVPAGHFTLKVVDPEGYIIYRLEFNITAGEVKRLDFKLDANNRAQSRVYGSISHKLTLGPMTDAIVELHRLSLGSGMLQCTTKTDGRGRFDISVPAGEYELRVLAEGQQIYSSLFNLDFGEQKHIGLSLEAPSRLMNWGNFVKLLQTNWLNMIGIALITVLGILLVAFVDRGFTTARDRIRARPRRFLNEDILNFAERVIKWNIVILIVLSTVYLISHIMNLVTVVWDPIWNSIASLYFIILLVIFMRIVLMVWDQVIKYMKGDHHHDKPKKVISQRMLTVIEIVVKYLVAFIFMLGILIAALAALGMSDMIWGGFIGWLTKSAGFLVFIVTLIVITFVITRFLSSFFEDMKTRVSRFRPEMIEIMGKAVNYLLYGIIGLILIFTVLSAAGLGTIGQTIILVFSLIFGLVVSMAATGSIGNMLSGLVMMSFKPMEEGDWVIIGNTHRGQVIETNLMFTKLRNWDDEVIEIPNNFVLSHGIVNWSTAARRGGFAVAIDATIGYDIPSRQVASLMKDSCAGITGILDNPTPKVYTTEFQNHAIGYKLRAYISDPGEQNRIRTELMVAMQKKFADAGVEILSPLFHVNRLDKIPTEEQVKDVGKRIGQFE
jgi:small-conductance mechanosensitive channel